MTATGIPRVDELLSPLADDGGVVLVCGPTGRGKTVLAVQTAVNACCAGVRTAFLSSDPDTDERNVLERGLSGACDTPYDRLVGGGLRIGVRGLEKSVPVPFDAEFSSKAHGVYSRLKKNLRFHFDDGLHADVATRVIQFVTDLDPAPRILLVDWLNSTPDLGAGDGLMEMRKRVRLAMGFLRAWSRENRMLVFVFCQADQGRVKSNVRAVRPDGISEFPELMDYADMFIGISGLGTTDAEAAGDASFSDNQ